MSNTDFAPTRVILRRFLVFHFSFILAHDHDGCHLDSRGQQRGQARFSALKGRKMRQPPACERLRDSQSVLDLANNRGTAGTRIDEWM